MPSSQSSSLTSPTTSYTQVSSTEPFLPHTKEIGQDEGYPIQPPLRKAWHQRRVFPWLLCGMFFITTAMLLAHIVIARAYCKPSQFGNFERGFSTDLDAALPYMEGRRVAFTGSVAFHPNGTMYRSYNPLEPPYVGPPSPAIDKAWKDLLYASAVDIPGELAGSLKDDTWREPEPIGLYRTGLDVFHQLHCVDYVRRALYPDYYPQEDDNDRLFMAHVEHCIDYIRQALMCFADSTPVRLTWRKESHALIPQFDQYHTCRNFDLLHDFSKKWALEIHNEEIMERLMELRAEGVL